MTSRNVNLHYQPGAQNSAAEKGSCLYSSRTFPSITLLRDAPEFSNWAWVRTRSQAGLGQKASSLHHSLGQLAFNEGMYSLRPGSVVSEIIVTHSIQKKKRNESRLFQKCWQDVRDRENVSRTLFQMWKTQLLLARQIIGVHEDALSSALTLGVF